MSRVNLERGEVGECGLGRAGLGAGWSVADALPGPDRGRTVTGKLEQRAAPALGRAPGPATRPMEILTPGHWGRGCGDRIHFHHKTLTTFPDLPA